MKKMPFFVILLLGLLMMYLTSQEGFNNNTIKKMKKGAEKIAKHAKSKITGKKAKNPDKNNRDSSVCMKKFTSCMQDANDDPVEAKKSKHKGKK